MLDPFFGFERSRRVAPSLTIGVKYIENAEDLQLNATCHDWTKSDRGQLRIRRL
jgi:hypothetical protein